MRQRRNSLEQRDRMEWKRWGQVCIRWTQDRNTLIACIVVLAGLVIGSLFVDLGQLVTGSGFSAPAIRTHDILVTGGKTWVGYTEPRVPLRIVNDETCADCDPSEALLWLRRLVPTLEAERINVTTETGKRLVESFRLTTVPAFIFDPVVRQTEFYTQAQPLFREENNALLFDINLVGMPIGRYLVAPEIGADATILGNPDAPVTLVLFSDFQCQYCKDYHATYKRLLAEYGDRLRIVWKHLPLPVHEQATVAAEAAECAAQQEQFMPYADILFARQDEWGRPGGERRFKEYAWRIRGLDARSFAACLDTGASKATIEADVRLADTFHIEAAPATFIGREFVTGAAPYADLRALVETALAK